MVATMDQQSGYNPDFSEFNVAFNYAKGEQFGSDRMTGKHGYYKKAVGGAATDEGYVVVASSTPVELVRMLDKGMMPLRQFGEFQLWNPQENWRVSSEPYRRIFQRPGGLQVFPVKQIIEHMWHIVPPYAGITFPQLAGIDLDLSRIRCRECQRWFTSEENLNKHRSVAHARTSQNTALGESIAGAVAKMNEPVNAVMLPMVEALRQQMSAFQAIVEQLNLSQAEQRQINQFLLHRANYGGHEGVPTPAASEPTDAPSAPPLDSSALDPNATAPKTAAQAKGRPAAPDGG